jgi:hypothetical protein
LIAESPARTATLQQATPEAQSNEAEERDAVELLETHIRFEADGSSRREAHLIVRLRTEAGAKQFASLSFDYNRAFEQLDLPLVRITHANGGTTDILPSAITDRAHPAVADAPAYAELRRKSVRVLGLQPGDVLEYRIVTGVARAPFAPDFSFSHNFAREDVSQEILEIDLPSARSPAPRTSLQARSYETEKRADSGEPRIVYRWKRPASNPGSAATPAELSDFAGPAEPDVSLTTLAGWPALLAALQRFFPPHEQPSPEISAKAEGLTRGASKAEEKLEAIYQFVSQKVRTIVLPLGATGFRMRAPAEVLAAGYGTPEEKCRLLAALANAAELPAAVAFPVADASFVRALPMPALLSGVLVVARVGRNAVWLDPSMEVAPYRMIPANVRGKPALLLSPASDVQFFENVPTELPFPAKQEVRVESAIGADGKLTAKLGYSLRGDDELVLRVAFHRTPKEQWKDVAAMLAGASGFHGRVTNVSTSDPFSTGEPFRVEYQIVQPGFADWTKPASRIPVPLPFLRLAELPATHGGAGSQAPPIELGTPLQATVECILQLPPETEVRAPTGMAITRDYAAYTSKYAVEGTTVRASRHLQLILREIPGERAADYAAFFRAVQNDESQSFTFVSKAPAAALLAGAGESAPRPPQP